MRDLLIATNNRGKLAEFRELLGSLPANIRAMAEVGIIAEVEEPGSTFADNAAIKASAYARLANLPALADDSGLMIDYLDGAPGVRSARYAGNSASDIERIGKVLTEMADANAAERTARFISVVAFSDADGNIIQSTEGICEGAIAFAPHGDNGFGYDPIFVPAGYELTFAELKSEVKDKISHRAIAVAKIIPFLQGFFKI
jgi:XTP/dITP diphosphohydrolase